MSDDREPSETALEAVLREIEDAEARADDLDQNFDHDFAHLEDLTTSDMPEIHRDE
ncbi:hypothetical protein [Streptomyces sp. T028]|uniref:hypothetical protein n=1 Tax=Streptomyces sp. T028 TaxID=3394379 RepID=UPI003A866049